MKAFLTVLSVIIVLIIAYLTLIFANRGENKFIEQYLAEPASPSASSAVDTSPSGGQSAMPGAETSAVPSPSTDDRPANPLTGLPLSDAASVNNRPVAIMINNLSTAQPQLGITKADIIYEILVEGGITRMMALFQDVSGAGEIGSIRSARPYFVDIALGWNAIYIHAGGSPDAYSELQATGITHLDGVNGSKTDIFFRDKSRQKAMGYEHSLVTTSDLVDKYLPRYGFQLVQDSSAKNSMTFTDSAVLTSGQPASTVKVHFSSSKTTSFSYSQSDGLYYITQYGKAYADGNSNTKIGVANVLVLKTRVNVISGDAAGRIEVDTVGNGSGVFINGGKYEEITWSRKNNKSQFSFALKDGTPFDFSKGKSYICIVATNNAVYFQ